MAELPMGNPQLNVHKTLFVGNLSYFCVDNDLSILLSPFGYIESIEIKRGKDTGDCLMHGFVEMGTLEAAEAAVANLHGQKFMGRRIRVSRGSSRTEDSERRDWIQLHVEFTSKQLTMTITEAVLEEVFSQFAEPIDCVVKRYRADQERSHQSGYGFVYFTSPEVIFLHFQHMKKFSFRNVDYDCSISYKSEDKVKEFFRLKQVMNPAMTAAAAAGVGPAGYAPPPMLIPYPNTVQTQSPFSSPSPSSLYPPTLYTQSPYAPTNNLLFDPTRTPQASPQYLTSSGIPLSPRYPPNNPAFNHPYGTMMIQPVPNPYANPPNSYTLYPPPSPSVATSTAPPPPPPPYPAVPSSTVATYSSTPFYSHHPHHPSVATPPPPLSSMENLSSTFVPGHQHHPPIPIDPHQGEFVSPRLAIQSYRGVGNGMGAGTGAGGGRRTRGPNRNEMLSGPNANLNPNNAHAHHQPSYYTYHNQPLHHPLAQHAPPPLQQQQPPQQPQPQPQVPPPHPAVGLTNTGTGAGQPSQPHSNLPR